MLNVSVSFLNIRGQFPSDVRATFDLPVFVALGASGNVCWALAMLMKRTMAVNEITPTVLSCSRWDLHIWDIGSQADVQVLLRCKGAAWGKYRDFSDLQAFCELCRLTVARDGMPELESDPTSTPLCR